MANAACGTASMKDRGAAQCRPGLLRFLTAEGLPVAVFIKIVRVTNKAITVEARLVQRLSTSALASSGSIASAFQA